MGFELGPTLRDSHIKSSYGHMARVHATYGPPFSLGHYRYVYLVDYAEKDLNFTLSDATFLISFIGILNTVGELIIGWVGDRSWANFNAVYAVCMVCCGLSTAAVPFLSSYGHLAVAASIYGFCISANYSLTSPMLVEIGRTIH